jgi:hypothetical protein
MSEIGPKLLTADVAKLLRRDVRTVHRMVNAGRLKAERVPGYKGPLLYDPDDVERLRVELLGEDGQPATSSAGAA